LAEQQRSERGFKAEMKEGKKKGKSAVETFLLVDETTRSVKDDTAHALI
jgi:hypothetical protein